MKKIVLTMAIAFGLTFAAKAQRTGCDYNYANDHDNSFTYGNYGDQHRIEDYGDRHYVGSRFNNDDDKDDILTRIGFSSGTTSGSIANYDDYGAESYTGGGLLGRGAKGGDLFSNRVGVFSPNLPNHGTHKDTDAGAPLGSGVLVFISFGAAYALSKKSKK